MSESILGFLEDATKEQCKLRLALSGPSGSGKTYSAIKIMMALGCERIAVLDTEHGSAAKYATEFPRKFKVVDNRFWKSVYDPRRLIVALRELGPHVDGIIVDSLTHFWNGPGGMLSIVDEFAKKAARSGKYDSYGAWKQADPIYNELIQTFLGLPCHFAAGLRAKTEHVRTEENGKVKITKAGMAAQIREGFEYEFDVEGMLDMEHNLIIGKTRCPAIDGKIFPLPGENIAKPLLEWMNDGVAPRSPEPAQTPPQLPESDVLETLRDLIENASDMTGLASAAVEVKSAVNDKKIGLEEKSELSKLYAKRAKELAAA